jgi:hypothetical protein
MNSNQQYKALIAEVLITGNPEGNACEVTF